MVDIISYWEVGHHTSMGGGLFLDTFSLVQTWLMSVETLHLLLRCSFGRLFLKLQNRTMLQIQRPMARSLSPLLFFLNGASFWPVDGTAVLPGRSGVLFNYGSCLFYRDACQLHQLLAKHLLHTVCLWSNDFTLEQLCTEWTWNEACVCGPPTFVLTE